MGEFTRLYGLNKGKKKKSLEKRAGHAISQIRNRSIRENINFDLDKEFLFTLFKKSEFCPICGSKLDYNGNDILKTPSVDKLIPRLGYIKKNVCIVCLSCNSKKSDMNIEKIQIRDNSPINRLSYYLKMHV